MKIFTFISMLYSSLLISQNLSFNDLNSKNIIQYFDKKTTPQTVSPEISLTQITQVGNYNTAKIIDNSIKSDISMSQIGDYNTTLFINAEVKEKTEATVNVQGTNNYIDITGSNSISNGMIINIKSDDKMIFMRNY